MKFAKERIVRPYGYGMDPSRPQLAKPASGPCRTRIHSECSPSWRHSKGRAKLEGRSLRMFRVRVVTDGVGFGIFTGAPILNAGG